MHFSVSSLVAITLTALPVAGAVDIDPGLNQAMNQVFYRLKPSGPGAYRAINRTQRLSAEFDGDAEYPLVVDPVWVQQQELVAPDGANSDNFGAAVSASGDTALIGAPGPVGSRDNTTQGAAYVFVRSGNNWTFQQKLTGLDGSA